MGVCVNGVVEGVRVGLGVGMFPGSGGNRKKEGGLTPFISSQNVDCMGKLKIVSPLIAPPINGLWLSAFLPHPILTPNACLSAPFSRHLAHTMHTSKTL